MTKSYEIIKIDTVPEADPYHASTGGTTYTELEIQAGGKVFVTQECRTGSTPLDVWNGVVLTAGLPHVDENYLREFLTDNEDIQKIIDGMDTVWNGSNHVGKHTDEAMVAFDELVEEINSWGDFYSRWSADEWLGQNTPTELGVSAKTTDAELEVIAEELEQSPEDGDIIDGCRVIVDDGEILEYITRLRDDLIAEDEQQGYT